MVEGDRWELYVPASLGYGAEGNPRGGIQGGATLVFTMEIVAINGGKTPAKRCNPTIPELPNCDEQERKYIDKISEVVGLEQSSVGDVLVSERRI